MIDKNTYEKSINHPNFQGERTRLISHNFFRISYNFSTSISDKAICVIGEW